jgi:hypothetical protein
MIAGTSVSAQVLARHANYSRLKAQRTKAKMTTLS